MVYSFCAPIAVAEAWRPATARTPWLGLRGSVVAAVVYLFAAALVLQDLESHSASAVQFAGSLAAAGLCVGAAVGVGRRAHGERHARLAPRLSVTLASFLLFAAATQVPETWTGVAITTTVVAAGGALLVHASRGVGWSVRQAAAVATGALSSRGVLAFSYYLPSGRRDLRGAQVRPQRDDAGDRRGGRLAGAPRPRPGRRGEGRAAWSGGG